METHDFLKLLLETPLGWEIRLVERGEVTIDVDVSSEEEFLKLAKANSVKVVPKATVTTYKIGKNRRK